MTAPFLHRIRVRARRQILWLRYLWSGTPGALGLAISHDEVDRILADTTEAAEEAFAATDPEMQTLASAIRDADAAHAADPLMTRLRRELSLSEPELDLLALAVAIEADPWLRRVVGYIHDDATSVLPTPWLARQLFRWPPGTRIGPESNLVRWRLAQPADSSVAAWSATAGWVVDPVIASVMLGGDPTDAGLGDALRRVDPASAPALCLYPDQLATLTSFATALAGHAVELAIAGVAGAGKRTLATQVCLALGVPLLAIDAGRALGPTPDAAAARELAVRVHRAARLSGAAVYWHDADALRLEAADVAPPDLAFLGSSSRTRPVRGDVVRRTVQLPALTQASRAQLWSTLSPLPPPPQVLDWSLLPSDLVRVAAIAPAGADAVTEACRGTLRLDAIGLATSLARPYEWTDLVLAPMVRRHLVELETQARLRWPVYEEWGFGKYLPMGRGIAALFAGPSGTGKTMAAQVLARALDMELYRVDLASIMSKYIGDTEKNLREIFDASERANVLLFFDEADALFGQRTEVKDAHDRFANIEIDYLLQRMEQFEGIAVLATNRKNEIDDAFLRRIRFIVDFLPPGVAERKDLWIRALPEKTSAGERLLDAIDYTLLAERLVMTGADIKNAAIAAAFLARSENARISMEHIMRASRREMAKHGVVLRAGEAS